MGDGRHRADPKGLGRYVIAGLGILIVVMLVLAGGYALYGALMAKPTRPTLASEPSKHHGGDGRVLDRAKLPDKDATLALSITGSRCYVSVRLPDGEMLLNRTLKRGDHRAFNQRKLVVTVGNSAAVDLRVNGKPYNTREHSQVASFTVTSHAEGG